MTIGTVGDRGDDALVLVADRVIVVNGEGKAEKLRSRVQSNFVVSTKFSDAKNASNSYAGDYVFNTLGLHKFFN